MLQSLIFTGFAVSKELISIPIKSQKRFNLSALYGSKNTEFKSIDCYLVNARADLSEYQGMASQAC